MKMRRKSLGLLVLLAAIVLPGKLSAQATRPNSIEELTRNANGGDIKSMYELGMRYQSGRGVNLDLTVGRQWLEKAAKYGNARAMQRLGDMYTDGRGGVAVDLNAGMDWFQAEADAGGNIGND